MRRTRSILAVMVLATVVPGPARAAVTAEVTNAIVSHDVTFFDEGMTHPAVFAYTGETIAASSAPVVLAEDSLGSEARLARSELAPSLAPDEPMAWSFAARGVPVKINAQDTLNYHALTPARANPYATAWYQRQETGTDLWHWGGALAGSVVSGTERVENAVFGLGVSSDRYPDVSEGPGGGTLSWHERTMLRSAVTTDHDPLTGEPFRGTFWGALARPSLRVVGGDAAFTQDTSVETVIQLPVKQSGLLVYSLPPAPPGVQISFDQRFDFVARTVTLIATIKAGSIWPASRSDPGDPSARAWEWTPYFFVPGWEYGDLINGGPVPAASALRRAIAPATLRADGSLDLQRAVTASGLPTLPEGLLDVNLPRGTRVATAWGDDVPVETGRLLRPAAADAARLNLAARTGDAAIPTSLEVSSGATLIGEVSMPVASVDGESYLLDDAVLLDGASHLFADGEGWRVALFRVGGVFVDLLVTTSGDWVYTYLWDGHSSDGVSHDVVIQTLFDPAIGGDAGDWFDEPFYTQSRYAQEMMVPQGMLDFPLGVALNGWWGSLPAVRMGDDGATVMPVQLTPTLNGTIDPDAARTNAYLLRDHGGIETDLDAAIADAEPIVETDVAYALENAYTGRVWDRGMLSYLTGFQVL